MNINSDDHTLYKACFYKNNVAFTAMRMSIDYCNIYMYIVHKYMLKVLYFNLYHLSETIF